MALEKMTMPQLGESVTEGTISKWLVSVGDYVKKYAPIAEVMTDKVNAEIPSSFSGTIKELIAKEGETLPVGEVICTIETDTSEISANEAEVVNQHFGEKEMTIKSSEQSESHQKQRYSPAVLKLSQEYGIDLTKVKGTGKGGRITRKDVLLLIETGSYEQLKDHPKEIDSTKSEKEEGKTRDVRYDKQKSKTQIPQISEHDIEIPVTGIRKTIAANMVRSIHEIPHAWTMVEVDVTNIVQLRDSIKEEFKRKEGFNLTYFAFFVKAVAQSLKEFPQMNSMWAGEKIVQKKDINISIAVATDDALYVPVIKHADEKSIKGIAREITELTNKVRNGKLTMEDVEGGTFTVNNTGSFGSIQSMGIINYPQAAILQVEAIVKRPVIKDGMIAIRDMVNLCLSLDHRVLDGLVCGRFLKRVKEILENMSSENTPIY